jgi:hypothetical protein
MKENLQRVFTFVKECLSTLDVRKYLKSAERYIEENQQALEALDRIKGFNFKNKINP